MTRKNLLTESINSLLMVSTWHSFPYHHHLFIEECFFNTYFLWNENIGDEDIFAVMEQKVLSTAIASESS